MLEEDRQAIRRMKMDFEALADLAENDFKDHITFERRMNHYNTVYTAATRNTTKVSDYPGYDAGEILYMEYNEMLTMYLWRYRSLSVSSEVELFHKILRIWDHYKLLMKWNMRTFGYLSRYYIVNHSKPSLHQIGLSIFLEQIFKRNAAAVSRVTQNLLLKERSGEAVDTGSIATAIDLFSSMRVEDTQTIYLTEFLEPYLEKTKSDYEEYLLEWSTTASASLFLQQMQGALTQERARCRRYFCLQDEDRIMTCAEGVLIESQITRKKLIESSDGFVAMLKNRDQDLLQQCYSFFARRESGIAHLACIVKNQIEAEGRELSERYSGDEASVNVIVYVVSMMHLQEVYPHILAKCFQLNFILSKAVRDGLEACYNQGVIVTSSGSGHSRVVVFCEWLSHYANIILQQDGDSVDNEMDRIVATLAYLTERDRFISAYREHMTDRILFPARRFNAANERFLIQRIRQRCGPTSTAHLESMLHDVEASNLFQSMDVLARIGKMPPFEVQLLVAKKGIWSPRLSTESDITLPPEVQLTLNDLRSEYLNGKSGRVLAWCHECSSAEVVGTFPKGSQSFFLCAVQALVLLCFNESLAITPQKIMDERRISFAALQRSLPPLIRSRVLLRKSSEPVLHLNDELRINEEYTSRTRKVRFPPSLVRVSVIASEQVSKQVEEDRKPAIDACLVRIMKGRRSIEHAELVEECHRQLCGRFLPDTKLIKQRIEDLLRKEYISRDARHVGMYHYIA